MPDGLINNAVIVKYGEIALRGNNRYLFENNLITHIKKNINTNNKFQYIVKKEQGRLLVLPKNGYDIDIGFLVSKLAKVIGISSICPCLMVESNEISNLQLMALMYMKEYHGKELKSFKVQTKRSDKRYPLLSNEISSLVGGYILENMPNLRVDVNNPDIILYIELRNYNYIYTDTFKAIAGLPVGSSGRGLLLLSGGIDSPVAGFLTAKRGVEIEAVYFHSSPYTSERAKQKVVDLAKLLAEFTGNINLHIVPFTEMQLYLLKNVPEDKLTIFLKRMMLRVSQVIANSRNIKVLINGDSIGQVASQNLASMEAIGTAVNMPLIRPLAGFNKQEIVDLAKKIGTYEISILPYEDCCTVFVPKHPELSPKSSVIERIEENLTAIPEIICRAVENTELYCVSY